MRKLHDGGANYTFADGHAKWYPYTTEAVRPRAFLLDSPWVPANFR